MNKFKIIITSYNNEAWTKLCLDSIKNQTYTNYEVLFFNDGSTDNTLNIAHNNLNYGGKFKVIDLKKNNTKSWIFANMLDQYIDDNDVVLFLDGDDWLSSDEVLNAINQYYEQYDPWIAYGGMVVWNGGENISEPYPQNSQFPDYILEQRSFRTDFWRSSHAKTMRGFLWKSIDKKNFMSIQDNQYILGPDDLVIMFDALERCPSNKIGRFDFPTYVYNHCHENVNRISEHQKKRGINYEAEIRSRQKNDLLPWITSELSGGLGNQMFQIAATVSLAYNLGYTAIFDPNKHFLPLQGRKFLTYKENIFRKIITSSNLKIENEYIQPVFNFTEIPDLKPFTILKGGYQSEKFFVKFLIKELFKIPINIQMYLLEKYGDVSNKVSIHVRRGDFLKLYPHHVFVGEEYYNDSLYKMKYNGFNKFLIFSDDLEWCKSFFKGNEFDFISDEDYNALYLMSLCGGNIIGNSTFSWWGAWLNNKTNKFVISPKIWFGPGYSNWNTRDLIPDGWVQL